MSAHAATVPVIEEAVRLALRSSAHCKVVSQDMRLLPELLRSSARQRLTVFDRFCSERFDCAHTTNPAPATVVLQTALLFTNLCSQDLHNSTVVLLTA